jgi:ATP/maltotriose-dependent transcriptional regulator MalT
MRSRTVALSAGSGHGWRQCDVSWETQAGQSQPRTAPATWNEIYGQLAVADAATLDVDDLESLAEAAFWLGRPRESIAARQQVYARYRDAGDATSATKTAWLLFYNHFDLDETSAASGWLGRAHRHAEEAPEHVAAAYVALADADWALYNGRLDEAHDHARRATDAGHHHRDRDLEALGLATRGRILIAGNHVVDGLDRLDEAMVAALSDELTPFATGWVYCLLLTTCQELGDVRRAAEWTDLAVRWCEERGQDSWYPGLCRLHRCEVLSLRGEWSAAEQGALRAAEELAPFGDYLIADGQYLAGEIRRRRGDFSGAEDAFRLAHQYGRDPQPGLALLRLAQGDADGAAAALRHALSGGSTGPLRRGRVLAAHVQAELRLGNLDTAAASAEDLAELADVTGALLLRGMAAAARGSVLLARGDVDAALPLLRDACEICRELFCPYEAAETRVLLGLAARAVGDEETAGLELTAARAIFQRLDATPDVERVDTLLASDTPTPRGLTAREVEVLRLVARGRSNREIGAQLFISEHTVARHLSNIFRKLDVTSRSAATSFAYEHHLA